MAKAKFSPVATRSQEGADWGTKTRVMISGVVLAIFWGALLYDYWPALTPAVMRIFFSAQAVGAQTLHSPYFEVHNNADTSEQQVREVVKVLDRQYQAISGYTKTRPAEKLQVLVVNGSGPMLMDGTQIIIHADSGLMDIDLAPLYLAVLIQEIPVNPAGGLVPGGGHALYTIEAAGLGKDLIRQSLDAWTILLRQKGAYVPLEVAWVVTMPNNDDGYYLLMRSMLESGSFMGWFAEQYGMEAAQQVARGDNLEMVSGKSMAENEAAWLSWLEQQKIQPQACEQAIPQESIFRLICKKLGSCLAQVIGYNGEHGLSYH